MSLVALSSHLIGHFGGHEVIYTLHNSEKRECRYSIPIVGVVLSRNYVIRDLHRAEKENI